MSVQGFGKRVAEARAADVEDVPQRPQRIADAARRGAFLVQDDQDRQQCLAAWTTTRCGLPPCRRLQPVFATDIDRLKRHRLIFAVWPIEPETFLTPA
jgi:hypothetical protein